MIHFLAFLLSTTPMTCTPQEARTIGEHIWMNESGKNPDKLISWNAGEEFLSLGLGHCIWYPAGKEGPFVETFPALVTFLKTHGAILPAWLTSTPHCPWSSRTEYEAPAARAKRNDLQTLLTATIDLQINFLIQRFEEAVPKILAAAPPERRAEIQAKITQLMQTPAGKYALLDYTNFKGDGTSPKERYTGQGWGLLQVLEAMPRNPSDPVKAFAESAQTLLKQRVAHAPPERDEKRWLAGWINRVNTYLK